ncbi:MAG: hypothetical protein V3R84_03490 [Acidimicrobiia bacterium]
MTEFVAEDILAAWAAGLAGAAAVVAVWRIVGPGFLWLAAFTAALFGLPALFIDPGVPPAVGAIALVAAAVGAKHPTRAAVAFAVACASFLTAASGSGVLGAITAAIFLGGISSEMILGHWYLVDPRLPRWVLFRLDTAAMVGLGAEVVLMTGLGVLRWASEDAVLGWAFVLMAIATGTLLLAVRFSLKEIGYPAVMAATGLSYLAMLTAVGTSVVGRIVLEGAG